MTFFEIENDQTLLGFKNRFGYPVWYYMRYVFFETLSAIVNNDKPTEVTRSNGFSSLSYYAKSIWHNLFSHPKGKRKVIFYSMSREVMINEKYFNQYIDDYAASLNGDSISIQHPPLDWGWKYPRHNNDVIFSAPAFAVASYRAKLCKKDLDVIKETFDVACQNTEELFDVTFSEEQKNKIIANTNYEMQRMHYFTKWFVKRCLKYKAQIVIMTGGSYSWYAELNDVLKINNIKVADLQHGCISSTNYVYNYSSLILQSDELKKYYPNYFLTYGEWWSKQSNIPFDSVISLGNPYREKTLSRYKGNKSNIVVLVGCNRKTEQYLELALSIKRLLPNYRVLFRPHPTERYETKLIQDKYIKNQVEIDYGCNLYELLYSTEILISEVSTVMFEAIGIVDNVFVWETQFTDFWLPNHPFDSFKTIDEFKVLVNSKTRKTINKEGFWDNDSINKFDSFIASLNGDNND